MIGFIFGSTSFVLYSPTPISVKNFKLDIQHLKKLVSKFKTNKIEIISDFLKMVLINKEKIKLTSDNLNRFNLNYINVNNKKIKLYEIVDYYSICTYVRT